MNKNITKYLSGFITPSRLQLFDEVLQSRTSYLAVILEDIYQPQNASAVLRTCDCFGIQNVHVIENRNTFDVSKEVALGSSKWLSIHKYNEHQNNSLKAIQTLKEKGYRIVATTPHKNDTYLQDFDLSKGKTALVFGSEKPGISKLILNEADEYLKIPMYGFTESFNISVSAAIVLHHLSEKLRKQPKEFWELNSSEKNDIKLQWLRNTIKRSDLLEQQYSDSQQKPGKS